MAFILPDSVIAGTIAGGARLTILAVDAIEANSIRTGVWMLARPCLLKTSEILSISG